MMFHNEYQLDQLINHRQAEIIRSTRESRRPSRLRVRLGVALITLGERLRGCAPVASTAMPAPRVHLHSRVPA